MIKLQERTLQAVQARRQAYDLTAFSNAHFGNASQRIADDYAERLALNSIEVCVSRCKAISLQGAIPSDFEERLVRTERNREALMGIRFFNGQASHPFVDVWPFFSVQEDADLIEIASALKEQFRVFSPLSFKLVVTPNQASQLKWHLTKNLGQSVWLGNSATVLPKLVNFPWPSGWSLQPVLEQKIRSWYMNQYATFHEENPKLKNRVPCNSIEEMFASEAESLLYGLYESNEIAGIVSGRESSFLGWPAIYMNEIFLVKELRGKGHGKLLEAQFLKQQLPKRDFVWGTIDSMNLPSARTARALGRSEVQSEMFFGLK